MDTLAEWLRRRPAKPMGSPRVGSNPTGVDFSFVRGSGLDIRGAFLPARVRMFYLLGHCVARADAAAPDGFAEPAGTGFTRFGFIFVDGNYGQFSAAGAFADSARRGAAPTMPYVRELSKLKVN